ncbi:hypothetical protein ACT02W_20465 [Enterobacter soli]|uniref:hypothetical protein n=1 Tax=Enterobacter soli TaxID=885040 RepID=UPI001C25C8BC
MFVSKPVGEFREIIQGIGQRVPRRRRCSEAWMAKNRPAEPVQEITANEKSSTMHHISPQCLADTLNMSPESFGFLNKIADPASLLSFLFQLYDSFRYS